MDKCGGRGWERGGGKGVGEVVWWERGGGEGEALSNAGFLHGR